MSLFIAWAAKTTAINYLGIAVNVPTEFVQNGYIAIDRDGSIWAYWAEPKKDSKHWHTPIRDPDSSVAGLQIFELGNYTKVIPELGNSETISEDYWDKTLVKISDCPVIVF